MYDGDTLKEILPHIKAMRGRYPEAAYCDRGFRGRKRVEDTIIVLPKAPTSKDSAYDKRKARKNFGRRSAIESVIGT